MAEQQETVEGTIEASAAELALAIGPALIASRSFVISLAQNPAFVPALLQNATFCAALAAAIKKGSTTAVSVGTTR